MEAKWIHKLRIMCLLPSLNGEHYRSRQHVSKKHESWWHTDPEKLDFGVHSRAKTQLPLFHVYRKCHQLGTQMGFKLVQVGASETRKLAKVGLGKPCKNTSQKKYNTCHKYAQKRGSKKVVVLWFLGSPSQYGLQGVPRVAPRPKNRAKWEPK